MNRPTIINTILEPNLIFGVAAFRPMMSMTMGTSTPISNPHMNMKIYPIPMGLMIMKSLKQVRRFLKSILPPAMVPMGRDMAQQQEDWTPNPLVCYPLI